ncbi:MAG: polysaccharide biosynthesis/export family protein [Burkholderiales bacterium]
MKITRIVRSFLPATVAVLLAACAATGTEPIEAVNPSGGEMMKAAAPEVYRFHAGDELSVAAVNRPELSLTTRVDPYGHINYPYVGQVLVKDLTAQEVAERLTRALQEGDYYKRVTLTVAFVSSREQFVYVVGEVKKPGPIPINGSISMIDAIGIANGPTHDAEMSTVMWVRGRQAPPGAVKVNMSGFGDPRATDTKIPNLKLIPGDVVYVPDSTLAATQRFFNRMFDIIRPFVALESAIVLWNDVELTLRGDYPRNANNTTTIIVNPLSR